MSSAAFLSFFPPLFWLMLVDMKRILYFPIKLAEQSVIFQIQLPYQKVCGSESDSDSEDEWRLPDVILDDLVNCRFQGKKRPKSFISKTTSPNCCLQIFSPSDTLATGLYELMRSGIFVLDLDVYYAAGFNSENNTPTLFAICLFLLTQLLIKYLWPICI